MRCYSVTSAYAEIPRSLRATNQVTSHASDMTATETPTT